MNLFNVSIVSMKLKREQKKRKEKKNPMNCQHFNEIFTVIRLNLKVFLLHSELRLQVIGLFFTFYFVFSLSFFLRFLPAFSFNFSCNKMCYNINDTFQINKSVFDMILGNNRQKKKKHETWLKETKWKTNEDIRRHSFMHY